MKLLISNFKDYLSALKSNKTLKTGKKPVL